MSLDGIMLNTKANSYIYHTSKLKYFEETMPLFIPFIFSRPVQPAFQEVITDLDQVARTKDRAVDEDKPSTPWVCIYYVYAY